MELNRMSRVSRLVGGVTPLVIALAIAGMPAPVAEAQDLPASVEIRFQPTSRQLGPGWRTGTLYTSPGDCAKVVTADPTVRGGRRVVQLGGIERLERKAGNTWIDVPVKTLSAKEPRWCGMAVGG